MALDKVCQIRRAGYNADGVAQLDLKADDDTFDWHWFYSNTDAAREILAAAITSGRTVECTVDDPAGGSSGITAIFLLA